jgi:RHS repeat-associated protein
VSNWTGSAWSKSYEHKFLYDGWNLVAILDDSNTMLYGFQWGTDLSGSLQGAGGVGGLVSMTVHSGANAGTYFYAFDGNGNVVALINAADGTTAARYEYGPFGELVRATGPLAFLNPFRFSTKFQDEETGFLYYGYRYYDSSTGRWPSRDPVNETGFTDMINGGKFFGRDEETTLNCFVGNDAINRIDFRGLSFLDNFIDIAIRCYYRCDKLSRVVPIGSGAKRCPDGSPSVDVHVTWTQCKCRMALLRPNVPIPCGCRIYCSTIPSITVTESICPGDPPFSEPYRFDVPPSF